jgi:hypothetical protein
MSKYPTGYSFKNTSFRPSADVQPMQFDLVHAMPCGLYYKLMTIVNDDSRVIKKLEASLTDHARGAI